MSNITPVTAMVGDCAQPYDRPATGRNVRTELSTQLRPETNTCPYSFTACMLTLAAALAVTSGSALAILYGSRWIARSLEAVEQFVYILLGTTTLTAAMGALGVYLIATRKHLD